MSKRVLLFVLSSVLMTFCISAQDYAVKGSVWDFDTAEPICSVAVSVYQITGNDTTFYGGCSTDDNGSFIIGQLKAGNYVLYAKSDNHFNTSKSFTLSSENVKDLGKISMRAGTGDLDPAITAVVAKIVDYFPENVYVDLGLSVMWATCNVGADKPEEPGDYYAWGEINTKKSYKESNYKWSKGSDYKLTKYCSDKRNGYNGFTDNKTVLDPDDDVAHVKWGGNWRIPTMDELQELKDNCTWTWDSINGMKGYRVTSNIPGYTDRSIFLPAAGGDGGISIQGSADYMRSRPVYYTGNYIANSVYTFPEYMAEMAIGSFFYSADALSFLYNEEMDLYRVVSVSSVQRYGRHSVRPVMTSPNADEWLSHLALAVKKESVTLVKDAFFTPNIIIRYDGKECNYPLEYTSDNPAVASVDNDGNVLAVSKGTAHITASFRTLSIQYTVTVIDHSDTEHEYVDLGLSVKWATCNVGAAKPEDYGAYYAWGEVVSKPIFYLWNYKYGTDAANKYTKYCTDSIRGYNGFTDGKTVLELEDDAAHVNWGGSWRMPTKDEWQELKDNCTWTFESINGINGIRVTSNKPGFTDRSIFLPAAGDQSSGSLNFSGNYFSSTLGGDVSAWYLNMHCDKDSQHCFANIYQYGVREYRHSVRPVHP